MKPDEVPEITICATSLRSPLVVSNVSNVWLLSRIPSLANQ
jgi:hypothetical protein